MCQTVLKRKMNLLAGHSPTTIQLAAFKYFNHHKGDSKPPPTNFILSKSDNAIGLRPTTMKRVTLCQKNHKTRGIITRNNVTHIFHWDGHIAPTPDQKLAKLSERIKVFIIAVPRFLDKADPMEILQGSMFFGVTLFSPFSIICIELALSYLGSGDDQKHGVKL